MIAATGQTPFCSKIKIRTKGTDALKPDVKLSTMNESKNWPWKLRILKSKKDMLTWTAWPLWIFKQTKLNVFIFVFNRIKN